MKRWARQLRVGACLGLLGCASSSATGGSVDGGGSSSDAHSSSGSSSGLGDATTDAGGSDSPTDADGAASLDAPLAEDACQASINVTVMDPTGRYPVPAAYVFISDGLPAPIEGGLGPCPMVPGFVARTAFDGSATIDVPTSGNVIVEALIGKWRTTQTVSVPACGTAAITMKLPGDSSHGNVPAIAVSTGAGDTLECTLHRMGIDGAVTLFQGSGGATTTGAMPSTALWASASSLSAFDAVILSCEDAETQGAIPDNLAAYLTAGGHVFAEHFQYAWFNAAPFSTQSIATWSTGANLIPDTVNADPSSSYDGVWLAQWLPPTVLMNRELSMAMMRPAHNATLGSAASLTLSTDPTSSPPNVPVLFSWPEGSGGVVYADFHVGLAVGDYGEAVGSSPAVPHGASFPSGCKTESDLTPSELVFLYTLFDSLSCLNTSIMR